MMTMTEFRNEFHAGQVIHHKFFDYRGVVVGVDQRFQLSEEWYEEVARSRPPKDQPWSHVLVHGSSHLPPRDSRSISILNLPDSTIHVPFFKRPESVAQYTGPRSGCPKS